MDKVIKILGLLIFSLFLVCNFVDADTCLNNSNCYGECNRCIENECTMSDDYCAGCDSCIGGICVSDCQDCENCEYISALNEYVCVDQCNEDECLECRNDQCRSFCRSTETCVDGECSPKGKLIPKTPSGTDEMNSDEEGSWTAHFSYSGGTSVSTNIEIDSKACSDSKYVSNVTSDQSISCSGGFDDPGINRVEGKVGGRSATKNVTVHSKGSESVPCKKAEIEIVGAGGGGAGGGTTPGDGGGSRHYVGIFDVSDFNELTYWVGGGGQGGESGDSGDGGSGLEDGGRGGVGDGSPEHAGGGGGSTVVATGDDFSNDDFLVTAGGGGGGAYVHDGWTGCYSWAGGGGGAAGDGGQESGSGDHGEDGDSPVFDRSGAGGSGADTGQCYIENPAGRGGTEKNSDYLISEESNNLEDSGGNSGSSRGESGKSGEVNIKCLPDPAYFEVDYIETDKDEYGEGEPVDVESRISNIGDEDGVQNIIVDFEDTYEQEVSLENDEHEFITVDEDFYAPMEVGTHTLTVKSDDDYMEKEIEVSEANFEFSDWQIDSSPTSSEDKVKISGEIENKSDVGGRDLIVLELNGEIKDAKRIGLGSGESTEDEDTPEISFEGSPEEDWGIEEIGEHIDVTVKTDELDDGDEWNSNLYLFSEPEMVNKTVFDNTGCDCNSPDIVLEWDYIDNNHEDYSANQDYFYIKAEDQETGEEYEFDNDGYAKDGETFNVYLDDHFDLDFANDYKWSVKIEDDNGLESGWEDGSDFRTPAQYPDVDFSFSPTKPLAEEAVNVEDESEIYTSDLDEVEKRKWDFGEDSNPEILEGKDDEYMEAKTEYNSSGSRNITLEITDEDEGKERTCSAKKSINVDPELPDWKEKDPYSLIIDKELQYLYTLEEES